MGKKTYVHQSQIDTFFKCQVRYEYRYIRGKRSKTTQQAIIGHGVHASIERNLKYKMKQNTLMCEEAVVAAGLDAMKHELERVDVEWTKEYKEMSGAQARNAMEHEISRLSLLHHKSLAPLIDPQHLEFPFVVDLRARDYGLAGNIDIIDVSGKVIDTKTSAVSKGVKEVHLSDQLTTYAWAFMCYYGFIPELEQHYLVKTKTPKALVHGTSRRTEDFKRLMRRIDIMIDSIKRGLFVPASSSSAWWCAKDWCPYHEECPYSRDLKVFQIGGVR